MVNQNVSISEGELDILKNIPGVKFDLPLTDQTYPALTALVGKFGSKVRKPGIYIFTHKVSGKKYVGSSNSLARRLEQYFSPVHLFSQLNYGVFLPFLKAEGIGAFSLEIFIMPPKFSHKYYFLFLPFVFFYKK